MKALAAKSGTHYVYLYQIRSGHRKPSHKMARKIVEAASGNLTLHDLRPDIWDKQGGASVGKTTGRDEKKPVLVG